MSLPRWLALCGLCALVFPPSLVGSECFRLALGNASRAAPEGPLDAAELTARARATDFDTLTESELTQWLLWSGYPRNIAETVVGRFPRGDIVAWINPLKGYNTRPQVLYRGFHSVESYVPTRSPQTFTAVDLDFAGRYAVRSLLDLDEAGLAAMRQRVRAAGGRLVSDQDFVIEYATPRRQFQAEMARADHGGPILNSAALLPFHARRGRLVITEELLDRIARRHRTTTPADYQWETWAP